MSTAVTINEDKLNAFLGKVVGDFGAALSADLVYIGQRLGLYQAMAKLGPLTPTELAKKTETHERYIREVDREAHQIPSRIVDARCRIGRSQAEYRNGSIHRSH